MTTTTLRYAIMTSAFVGSMFVSPPESKAIFHWCKGCGQPAAAYPVAPAYVAPVIPAPAPVVAQYAPPCNSCAPACAPAVVNYAPQVSYRPVVVNTPVTTYQPVAGCGPCGQPVTSMRPVTTMVQTTQYVPYTSYRPVYSVGYAAAVAAPQVVQYAAPAPAPVPVAAQYAPQPPVQYAPPQTVQYPPQPTVPYTPPVQYQPAPTVAPAAPYSPTPAAPASSSPSDARPGYDPNNPPTTTPDIRMKPTPEDPQLQYKAAPAATIPSQQAATELDNRTAARPVTGGYRPYTAPTQVRPVTTSNEGWRPSGR